VDPTPYQEAPDLILTAAAVERLRDLVAASGDTEARIRIEVEGSAEAPAFTFSLENVAGADDAELDFVDVRVVVDPDSRAQLRGHEVDHRHGEQGELFVVRLAQ
jgi:Fe-S cluster assembly iron-binding protein IscA